MNKKILLLITLIIPSITHVMDDADFETMWGQALKEDPVERYKRIEQEYKKPTPIDVQRETIPAAEQQIIQNVQHVEPRKAQQLTTRGNQTRAQEIIIGKQKILSQAKKGIFELGVTGNKPVRVEIIVAFVQKNNKIPFDQIRNKDRIHNQLLRPKGLFNRDSVKIDIPLHDQLHIFIVTSVEKQKGIIHKETYSFTPNKNIRINLTKDYTLKPKILLLNNVKKQDIKLVKSEYVSP